MQHSSVTKDAHTYTTMAEALLEGLRVEFEGRGKRLRRDGYDNFITDDKMRMGDMILLELVALDSFG